MTAVKSAPKRRPGIGEKRAARLRAAARNRALARLAAEYPEHYRRLYAEERSLPVVAEVFAEDLGDFVRSTGSTDECAEVCGYDGCHRLVAIREHHAPAQQADAVDDFGDVGAGIRNRHIFPNVHAANSS